MQPWQGASARLRALVTTMDTELSRWPGETGLRASFAELVQTLDLGPEPELRECPVCHNVGMRAATRCGYCWTQLSPPPADAQPGAPRPGM